MSNKDKGFYSLRIIHTEFPKLSTQQLVFLSIALLKACSYCVKYDVFFTYLGSRLTSVSLRRVKATLESKYSIQDGCVKRAPLIGWGRDLRWVILGQSAPPHCTLVYSHLLTPKPYIMYPDLFNPPNLLSRRGCSAYRVVNSKSIGQKLGHPYTPGETAWPRGF